MAHILQELPLPMRINAPAILILVQIGLVVALGEIEELVIPGRLIGMTAGTAHPINQQSANGQGIVSNHFGRQSEGRLAAKEPGDVRTLDSIH